MQGGLLWYIGKKSDNGMRQVKRENHVHRLITNKKKQIEIENVIIDGNPPPTCWKYRCSELQT